MQEVKCQKCGYVFYRPEGLIGGECPKCGSSRITESKK
jgi:predicted Zn-ribbon and HTH transcriptional regulator